MKKILKTVIEEFFNWIMKAIQEHPFYIWEVGIAFITFSSTNRKEPLIYKITFG